MYVDMYRVGYLPLHASEATNSSSVLDTMESLPNTLSEAWRSRSRDKTAWLSQLKRDWHGEERNGEQQEVIKGD